MTLDTGPKQRTSPWELAVAPAPEKWDDWTELDPAAWPERVEKHYALIPTICFNCESACGLVAYVDGVCVERANGQALPFTRTDPACTRDSTFRSLAA